MKMHSFKKRKYGYVIHTWSDNAFKSTFVNRALTSLNEGSLEISLTVPLNKTVEVISNGPQNGTILILSSWKMNEIS